MTYLNHQSPKWSLLLDFLVYIQDHDTCGVSDK